MCHMRVLARACVCTCVCGSVCVCARAHKCMCVCKLDARVVHVCYVYLYECVYVRMCADRVGGMGGRFSG